MSRPSDIRTHNRQHMPTVAAMVDELRQTFPGLTVEYASEGDYEMGTKREYDAPVVGHKHGCEVVKQIGETDLGLKARIYQERRAQG